MAESSSLAVVRPAPAPPSSRRQFEFDYEYGAVPVPVSRLSTSVLRDEDFGFDLAVAVPVASNRHTLTCLETPYRPDEDEDIDENDNENVENESSGNVADPIFSGKQYDGFGIGFGVPSWRTDESTTITPRAESAPYEGITVEIKNHSINNQGVVMYHVDIGGRDGILSMYTIRRRFRAFRNLYFEMDRLMTEYAAQLALMPQDDDPCLSEAATDVPCSPVTLSYEHQRKAMTMMPPVQLPPLPSAGIWTYLKRHDIHLVEHRKKCLQEVLRLVMQHPATRCSPVLDTFLSVAPNQISQRGTSYVSLQDYSVPVLDRKRESIERKQRKIRVLEQRQRTSSSSAPFSASHGRRPTRRDQRVVSPNKR